MSDGRHPSQCQMFCTFFGQSITLTGLAPVDRLGLKSHLRGQVDRTPSGRGL